MTTIQNIEKANFLASVDDVEKLAREQYTAASLIGSADSTYFRVLLANVQAALLGSPVIRARAVRTPVDTAKHLETFEEVNERLYGAVVKGTVTPDIAPLDGLSTDEMNRRAKERNRRNTFARSAASTLRRFIRLGGDVRKVVVTTASKTSMAEATPQDGSTPSEDNAKRRVKRAAARLTAVIEEMAATDRAAAATALQESLGSVMPLLAALTGRPTDKPSQAIADHKLLKTPAGMFWPVVPPEEMRTQ